MIMPTYKEIPIKVPIESSREPLTYVKELVSLSESGLSSIQKRSFVRNFAALGECLSFFEIKNPLLTEIQSIWDFLINKSVVFKFKDTRNQLLHQYVIDHLRNDESIFNSALEVAKHEIPSLEAALNKINSKQEVINGAICKKEIRPPEDRTKNTILDYAQYASKEITAFNEFLFSVGIRKETTPEQIDVIFKSDKHIKFALFNFIENSTSLLNLYNLKLNGDENYYSDEKLEGIEESLQKKLSDFIENIKGYRNIIAHDTSRSLGTGIIKECIDSLQEINANYLSKVIPHLNTVFEQKKEEDTNKKKIKLPNPFAPQPKKIETTSSSSSSSSSSNDPVHGELSFKQLIHGSTVSHTASPSSSLSGGQKTKITTPAQYRSTDPLTSSFSDELEGNKARNIVLPNLNKQSQSTISTSSSNNQQQLASSALQSVMNYSSSSSESDEEESKSQAQRGIKRKLSPTPPSSKQEMTSESADMKKVEQAKQEAEEASKEQQKKDNSGGGSQQNTM